MGDEPAQIFSKTSVLTPLPKPSGFTLMEIIIVMALIAVLTIGVLASFTASLKKSRDGRRKSDLRVMQNSLALYNNSFNQFPANDVDFNILGCGVSGITVCPWGGIWQAGSQVLMKKIPNDPLVSRSYRYERVTTESYQLKTCLEYKSDGQCSATVEDWCNAGLNGCLYVIEYE